MSRVQRVTTVVRIRELQERMAEAEAISRQRAVAARARAVEDAHRDLEDRTAARPAALSFHEFARQRALLDGAVSVIDHRTGLLGHAEEELETARRAWHEAHQRHDAVDRLLDRAIEADRADELRRTQTELDDIVSTRHGRRTDTAHREEAP